MEGKSLRDIADTINHCTSKICFIREVFRREVSSEEESFSQKAREGFQFIMDDLEDELEDGSSQIMEIFRRQRDQGDGK